MNRLKLLPTFFGILFLSTSPVLLASNENPGNRYNKILHSTGAILKQVHFSPKNIDDSFSVNVFKLFIERIDPNKDIFIESDIKLLSKYKTRIDNEINGDSIEFFNAAVTLFSKRIKEISTNYKTILEKPFNFLEEEWLIVNDSNLTFARTTQEQAEKWRKRLKYLALQKYAELYELSEKYPADSSIKKTDAELEKEAREYATSVNSKYLNRMLSANEKDNLFSVFINTITNYMDPHTDFFMPIEKRAWNEDITGKFYGIGAVIGENNGQLIISAVSPGGAAWKTGEVNNGDIILKIAEDESEPVDVAGYEILDAVKLIRGNKGTVVKLTLKKTDGSIKTVGIARQELKLEETFAKSSILFRDGKKFGYISLPKFYTDFNGDGGASCSKDVAKEIVKLKRDGIEGLIIDLRDNGGGSLYEVVQMVGLFIPTGPVVQVKSKDEPVSVLFDRDRTVLYNGPLEVLVNEFSASASEIFAAAIQDYKRGIITGSSSTYGKGTVQRPYPISNSMLPGTEDLGTLHITIQKYYRINGGTTQLLGVTPDIILPGYYEYYSVMEKDNKTALQWDEISKIIYQIWNTSSSIAPILQRFSHYKDSAGIFEQIRNNTQWLAKESKEPISLHYNKYKKQQIAIREKVAATRTLLRLNSELQVDNNETDKLGLETNKEMQSRNTRFISLIKTDVYIAEALKIIYELTESAKAGMSMN